MAHFCRTTYRGRQVIVRMGYSRRPEPGYVYMTVVVDDSEYDEADDAEDEGIVYSNLNDPQAGIRCLDGNYYRQVLSELDLPVPESMFAETMRDQAQRAADREVEHHSPTQ